MPRNSAAPLLTPASGLRSGAAQITLYIQHTVVIWTWISTGIWEDKDVTLISVSVWDFFGPAALRKGKPPASRRGCGAETAAGFTPQHHRDHEGLRQSPETLI